MDTKTFHRLREVIYDRSGIALGEHKRALVGSRLGKRENDLEDEFGVQPSEFAEPKYSIYSHAVFTPFYGKDAVLNRGIVNRETYFLLGGGIVNYDNKKSFEDSSSETAPSLSFGVGQKFFIKENYALNLELRNITNFRDDDTEWRIYLGASFGFRFDLSPRKQQKDPKIEKLNDYLKED